MLFCYNNAKQDMYTKANEYAKTFWILDCISQMLTEAQLIQTSLELENTMITIISLLHSYKWEFL